MTRLLALLRSPWIRAAFVVAAVAGAVVALSVSWDDVVAALGRTSPLLVVAAGLVAPAYVLATMLAWHAVLGDLGSRLRFRDAFAVFFVSQLGKYLPGSLWNVLAAAELGADRQIPRRRSLAAMGVALLVGLTSGGVLGLVGVALAPQEARGRLLALAWVVPALAVLVAPPVSNRLVGVVLRLMRRPPLEHPLSLRGTAGALAWSVLGWLLAGLHVWLLAVGTGMAPTFRAYVLCTGAYAVAWVAGFLAVPLPAGVGVREVLLVALLGQVLDPGSVLVVVLLSRAVLTAADLGLGALGAALQRRAPTAPREQGPPARAGA